MSWWLTSVNSYSTKVAQTLMDMGALATAQHLGVIKPLKGCETFVRTLLNNIVGRIQKKAKTCQTSLNSCPIVKQLFDKRWLEIESINL